MVKAGTQGVEFIAINTDKQALAVSNANQKIQIGEKMTRGQGAGSGSRGRQALRRGEAATTSPRPLRTPTWRSSPPVWAAARHGRCSLVAEIARDAGILTVGVVTKPSSLRASAAWIRQHGHKGAFEPSLTRCLSSPMTAFKYATDQKVTLCKRV